MIKKAVIITLILNIIVLPAFAQDNANIKRDTVELTNRNSPNAYDVEGLLMIGYIEKDRGVEELSKLKVEGALNAAALLSRKYLLIPLSVRDSVSDLIRNSGGEPNVLNVAKRLQADKILFVKVARFGNTMRMGITAVDVDIVEAKTSGEGWAFLRYRKSEEEPLYDPSLLVAAQRALASSFRDSNMYSERKGKFRVFPAAPLVVGGIEYKNDTTARLWEIFDSKVVTSYDAVETIFEAARESDKYVPYDIATRDSVYALFNLRVVENYSPPSAFELQTLNKFDVEYYITGKLTRKEKGARLELGLYEIIGNKLKPVRKAEGLFESDDIKKYRKLLKRLTREILKIPGEEKH